MLSDDDYAAIDSRLAAADAALLSGYPGDDGRRQPVQTAYVSAEKYGSTLASDWGRQALAAADDAGGVAAVAELVGLTDAALPPLVIDKLRTEPIEDLRVDFEDGYGHRADDIEDADVIRCAREVAESVADGGAPPFIGIRFKCFEAPTRARGIRTLDMFLAELIAGGGLPPGLTLTLPKVTSVDQVRAMVDVCERLELAHGLPTRRLGFEVQVETPQLILGAGGTVPAAQLIHVADGRVSSLHYGTYDYSASLGIAAEYQSMEHPAADHAKNQMQLAVAGTGVHMSDGSTNVIPVGDADTVAAAWRLHARLVRRHLERGIYQGWDLHPAQLVTRYLATYAFYRNGFDAAATRLRNYVHQIDSSVMDEPATARALAAYLGRGLVCGAVTADELTAATRIDVATLQALALNKPLPEGK
ncbi:DUF6986 family protein [Jongsikchunia kroppenstedtii]|uniref:DUF6986 family protein n=1 Tax=Jongsikchunia kroppenstedtii TaxID=1121721 RepID=UPI00037A0213|nr:hypothetical protein [Jongsikchunia kroppenstedtii]